MSVPDVFFVVEVTRELSSTAYAGSSHVQPTLQQEVLGTIRFKLFDDINPMTCRNFRELATGQHGYGYQGSIFNRIIPGFIIQGGRFVIPEGFKSCSIYGKTMHDENLSIQHDRRGLLSMVSSGPNSGGSQFYITMEAVHWLDGFQVVFGEVADDSSMEVVKKINDLGSSNGVPLVKKVCIVRSGTV